MHRDVAAASHIDSAGTLHTVGASSRASASTAGLGSVSSRFWAGDVSSVSGGGAWERREKHLAGYEISHIKDAASKTFSTRTSNVFIIGEGNRSYISLPKGKGIKLSIMEEAALASKKE